MSRLTTMTAAFILSASVMTACAAESATASVNPQNLPAVLENARSGDLITLPQGNYGALSLRNRSWSKPVTIDAHAASFSTIHLDQVDGLTIQGGTVIGGDEKAKGIFVSQSHNITLTDMSVSKTVVGIVLQRSQNIVVRGVTLSGMIADGIHVAMSQHVVLDHNVCRDFTPTPKTFENGRMVKDELHPDCIQGWSRAQFPPVSDVVISNNVITGNMQGISFFNKVKNGVDDGGFDRITITGNKVLTTRPRGISLLGGRNSVVRDNDVRSIPGSVLARNGSRVSTRVSVEGTGNIACGNIVPDKSDDPEAQSCRR